jgi:glucokinase
MILAGDIGGTHARLALYDDDGKKALRSRHYESRAHAGLLPIVRDFLGADRPHAAAVGVAGPVEGNRCKATNLPWTIDGDAIGKALGVKPFVLLNDLVATGLGCLVTPKKNLVSLHAGLPKRTGATMAVIAAGTGLGESLLVWDGAKYVPVATEGAHADFAARDEVEFALFERLKKEHGHVSVERVCSASSLAMLHAFFRDIVGIKESAEDRRAMREADDPNAAVLALARRSKKGPAAAALAWFFDLYGAEAGNLVLKSLATGGLFVCGGLSNIAEPELRKSTFIKSFLAKGRMRRLLEKTPVVLVKDSETGLRGSAYHASRS